MVRISDNRDKRAFICSSFIKLRGNMKLGKYTLTNPVFMAPMAGITDKAFREIIHMTGGKYVITEMISDKALLHNNSRTFQMLNLRGEEEPRIVQLFGSEPEPMAKAAQIAVQHGANVIDINMGCPTPKIVKNGEGAELLRNLPLAQEIASSIIQAVDVPVTVKMRLGWDLASIIVNELALELESIGVSMLTLHARTREQYYSGKADWSWIKALKETVKIPVIGNGDIQTPQDALRMMKETGCDGVMIGRGALGNPWLIHQTQNFLYTDELISEPDAKSKLLIILKHFEKLVDYKGEKIGINEMRKHAAWYIKGLRNAAEYRNEIMKLQDKNSMQALLEKVFEEQKEICR